MQKVQVFRFDSHKEVLNFVMEAFAKEMYSKSDLEIYASVRRLYPIIPPTLIELVKALTKNNKL